MAKSKGRILLRNLFLTKNVQLEKWSISNIEEFSFFQRNSQFCIPFNNGDRQNLHWDVFVHYNQVYPVSYLVLRLENKLNSTKFFIFRVTTRELPISALESQNSVLYNYTVSLWICHTNSGRLQKTEYATHKMPYFYFIFWGFHLKNFDFNAQDYKFVQNFTHLFKQKSFYYRSSSNTRSWNRASGERQQWSGKWKQWR